MRLVADTTYFNLEAGTANSIETERNSAREHYEIQIPPTRLKNIVVRITVPPGDYETNLDRIRIFYFKGVGGGEQSELIYLTWAKNNVIRHVTDEGEFWSGYPFMANSIAFYGEGLTRPLRIAVQVFAQ